MNFFFNKIIKKIKIIKNKMNDEILIIIKLIKKK